MEVGVGLGTDERNCRVNAKDMALEREACGREPCWTRAASEVSERYVSHRKEPGPVLERLDVPAFDAAGEGRREVNSARLRGSGKPRPQNGEGDDEGDKSRPSAPMHYRLQHSASIVPALEHRLHDLRWLFVYDASRSRTRVPDSLAVKYSSRSLASFAS